jgi:predicted flavoprotein YhiN
MGKLHTTPTAHPDTFIKVVEALEAMLDLFVDGRVYPLDEKEKAVYDMANAAIEKAEIEIEERLNPETATNSEKLSAAIGILQEISENWNEDEVLSYPKNLSSFNELVADLAEIEFK